MSFNPGNISKADAAAYSSSASDDSGEDDVLGQPRKRRRTGHAKESAALGIFGSESEDDGGRRSGRKKDLRHKNMTFVSGGQEKLDEGEDEDEEDDDDEYAKPSRFGLGAKTAQKQDEEDDYDDEEGASSGVGLGFRSGQGLGWAPPTQTESAGPTASAASKPFIKNKYDGKTALGRGFVPSSANQPVLKANLQDEPSTTPTPKPSAFGSGGGKAKSFAERMMAKMGWEKGQGLGAQGQGRNVIIEAALRPQGVGLGAVKEKSKQEREEEKRQARLRGEEAIDSDEEKKKRKRAREKKTGLDSGSASGATTPRRPKTKFLTVNDIKKVAPGLHIPDTFAPILDMTGPGQKMLTSGSGLLTPTASTENVEQIEARKLANRAQRELGAFVEEWKTLEERKAWLDMETHQRMQELDELESEFSTFQTFASVLDEISRAAKDREWDPIISSLRKAEAGASTPNDDLAGIAVAVLHPFLTQAVQGWEPLEDPKLGNFVSDLTSIRGVLGLKNKPMNGNSVAKWDGNSIDGTHRHHQKSTTPYESMIYKLIFPKIATAISQNWDVHDANTLLSFFDKWDNLLPAFVRSQLLEQVVRRLDEAISNWKPKKHRHNLPHLWLFPWLQHLPAHHLEPKGSGLVADVRRKYRQVIDSWEFDRGVIPGLKEWKDVFRPSKSQDQWKPLVMHHILPSMAKYLRIHFRVEPSDQEPYIPMLLGIFKWTDIIAPSMIAEVMVAEVFPMWHDVLYQWLTADDPNLCELAEWCEWWNGQVFPSQIASTDSISAEFDKCCVTLSQAMQALQFDEDAKARIQHPGRKPAHQPKSTRSHGQCQPTVAHKTATPTPKVVPEPVEKSFRDEIEDWCTENDIRFIPTHKSCNTGEKFVRLTARMDGKGGVMAYFKKGADLLVVENRKPVIRLARDKKEEWNSLSDVLFKEVE